MTDAKGNPTTVKAMSTEGVTGSYRSSEGIKDDAVWSSRGRWMDLNGTISNEKVAIVICDHPKMWLSLLIGMPGDMVYLQQIRWDGVFTPKGKKV